MAEYIHDQSGARVSVADGKVLGVGFTPIGEEPSGEPGASWTVGELKAYAEENGIDLGGATKKDDIIAVISAHSETEDESDETEEV